MYLFGVENDRYDWFITSEDYIYSTVSHLIQVCGGHSVFSMTSLHKEYYYTFCRGGGGGGGGSCKVRNSRAYPEMILKLSMIL